MAIMSTERDMCCPTCGQTLPLKNRPEGVYLSRLQGQIWDTVQKAGVHGILSDRLYDLLYQNDPNGGPDSRHCLSVHVWHLNCKIRPIGWEVRAESTGSKSPREYKLRKL